MYVQINDRKVMYRAIVSIWPDDDAGPQVDLRRMADMPYVLIVTTNNEHICLLAPTGMTARDTVANLVTAMKHDTPYIPED